MADRRRPLPPINAAPILCGVFRRGRSYTNWRPHGSGDWLLIMTKGGAGRIRTAAGELLLRVGDAVLFAPGTAQDYSTDQGTRHWNLRWVHFQPRTHWSPWLKWPEMAPGVGQLSLKGITRSAGDQAFERMVMATHLGGVGWEHLALNALEEYLLWTFRLISEDRLTLVDPRVQRAVTYLASHCNLPFQLDQVAAHCGLSSSRFSHIFRRELGITPQQFSEKLRLDTARSLLIQTNLTIAEVAEEVGFSDQFYFSRRFRRAFGHAPSAKREARPRG